MPATPAATAAYFTLCAAVVSVAAKPVTVFAALIAPLVSVTVAATVVPGAAKMNELVPTIWPVASTASSTYLPASSPASANRPLPVVDVVPAIRPVNRFRARTTALGNGWPADVTTVPLMAIGAAFCTAVLTALGRVAAVACAACSGIEGDKAAS